MEARPGSSRDVAESLLDTYHAERHPAGARVLRNTMALTAIDRAEDRIEALREMISELLHVHATRKQYAAMMSGLDIHYDLGKGHPLLGRRMPDLDMVTANAPLRLYTSCTMPGRRSSISGSPAASTSLHGRMAFS
jgi:3-(3-hydroxy-phenyl)propionate hydroxylase